VNTAPRTAVSRIVRSLLILVAMPILGGASGGTPDAPFVTVNPDFPKPVWNYTVKQDVHGKPTVTLNEKFTIPVSGGASGVAWSPDGSILGVAGGMIFSAFSSSGHYLSGFDTHGLGAMPLSTAFLDGSKQVVFSIAGNTIRGEAIDVRDVETGKIVHRLMGESPAHEFSVSPDQSRVAFASYFGKKVVTYDTRTWQPISTVTIPYPRTGVASLAFFPDNKRLAIGSARWKVNELVTIVDSTTGTTLQEFEIPISEKDGDVSGLAVSPHSDLLFVGMSSRTIHILRLSDWAEVASLKNPGIGLTRGQALWDPQGRFVAYADRFSAVLWQPQLSGDNFIEVKFSSPAEKVPSFETGQIFTTDPSSAFALTLAITRDGNTLAVTHGDSVTVFNIH
jgi:WD40 repeat protein